MSIIAGDLSQFLGFDTDMLHKMVNKQRKGAAIEAATEKRNHWKMMPP